MTRKTSAEYKYTVNRLNSVKMPSIVLDRRIFTYIYKVINIINIQLKTEYPLKQLFLKYLTQTKNCKFSFYNFVNFL